MTAGSQQHPVAGDVARVARAMYERDPTIASVVELMPLARAALEAVGQSGEGSITLDNASVQRLLDYGVLRYGENGWFVDASSPTPGEAE